MKPKHKPIGLADQATISLKNYLLKSKFQPGDVLPGEIELSQRLGVSRTIVREALSRFRMMGVVESRRRRGMVLQSPDLLKGIELAMDGSWLKRDTLREMMEFRIMLEIGLADFLFDKRNGRLLNKLNRLIIKEEKAGNGSERHKADIEFHAALYEATGNESLTRLQKMLLPLFNNIPEGDLPPEKGTEVTHRNLLDELRNGTPGTFRAAMRRHLEPQFQYHFNNGE